MRWCWQGILSLNIADGIFDKFIWDKSSPLPCVAIFMFWKLLVDDCASHIQIHMYICKLGLKYASFSKTVFDQNSFNKLKASKNF